MFMIDLYYHNNNFNQAYCFSLKTSLFHNCLKKANFSGTWEKYLKDAKKSNGCVFKNILYFKFLLKK